MSDFDDSMRLTGSDGALRGNISEKWSIGHAINGGVLMALGATAIGTELGPAHPDPFALSAHFLAATAPGEVEAHVQVLRRGRALATGQCAISQAGPEGDLRERVRVVATFGNLDVAQPVHRTIAAPPIAALNDCFSAADAPPDVFVPLAGQLDARLDPACAGWVLGEPSGRGQLDAWVQFADGRRVDPVSLLFLLDALPPAAFDLGIIGWAPTIEFSGHVRARPAAGWLQMQTITRVLTGNLMEEEATIWDSTGALVAQSRQLCSVRLPEGWAPPPR